MALNGNATLPSPYGKGTLGLSGTPDACTSGTTAASVTGYGALLGEILLTGCGGSAPLPPCTKPSSCTPGQTMDPPCSTDGSPANVWFLDRTDDGGTACRKQTLCYEPAQCTGGGNGGSGGISPETVQGG